MKNLVLILLVVLVFFACATAGYQAMDRLNQAQDESSAAEAEPTEESVNLGEQHNLVVVHVDSLDEAEPRLLSVWFVSLFFVEAGAPTLTLAEIYPTRVETSATRSLKRSFSLDEQGEPAAGFWQAVRAFKFKWEGYLIVDEHTVQRIMEWTNGQGSYKNLVKTLRENPRGGEHFLLKTCQAVGGIDNREGPSLDWGDLVPGHFRSDLRMEAALTYWHKITAAQLPVKCEVLLAK